MIDRCSQHARLVLVLLLAGSGLTTSAHGTHGLYIESLCHEPPTGASGKGDALVVCVENHTSQFAADLHVTFTGSGGNLFVDPLVVVAGGCPTPFVPSNPPAVSNTVEIDWGEACVGDDETLVFLVRTSNGPLEFVSAAWTDEKGAEIGPADTCYVRSLAALLVPPPPEPPPPTWAIKVSSRYVGGARSSTAWVGVDGCVHRWDWRGPKWCFTQVFFCPFASGFSRLLEFPIWIPITPEFHSAFIPGECRYKKDTEIATGLCGSTVVFGHTPDYVHPELMMAPYDAGDPDLDTRYSDDGGVHFRSAADFTSTFLTIVDSLKIVTRDQNIPAPSGHPNILRAVGERYASAALLLAPLLNEVQIVEQAEPGPTITAIHQALISLQGAMNNVSAHLQLAREDDPQPYDELAASLRDLAQPIRLVPYPRFANPANSLEQAADVATCVADVIRGGIDTDVERSTHVGLLYNDLPSGLEHFATGMAPHLRIQLDLGNYKWGPATIEGVQVVVQRMGGTPRLDEFVTRLSVDGDFDVPLSAEYDNGPLRVWFKPPTYLGHAVEVQSIARVAGGTYDGLFIGPVSMVPGDANSDNCVDQADIGQVQADLGMGGWFAAVPPSDVNGNGIVDVFDLSLVLPNLGECGATTDVAGNMQPTFVRLLQNLPNPVRITTSIRFELPDESLVSLDIYNARGQRVDRVLERQMFRPGQHHATFDARKTPNGIYMYRMVARTAGTSGRTIVREGKMVVAR